MTDHRFHSGHDMHSAIALPGAAQDSGRAISDCRADCAGLNGFAFATDTRFPKASHCNRFTDFSVMYCGCLVLASIFCHS